MITVVVPEVEEFFDAVEDSQTPPGEDVGDGTNEPIYKLAQCLLQDLLLDTTNPQQLPPEYAQLFRSLFPSAYVLR
jgi:hypothetical protein